jgi:hypothetical protein
MHTHGRPQFFCSNRSPANYSARDSIACPTCLLHQAQTADANFVVSRANSTARNRLAPLNIVGSVANYLFDILNTDDLNEINNKLEQVDKTEDEITHLLHSQVTVLNTTYQIANKNSRNINILTQSITMFNERVYFHRAVNKNWKHYTC